MKKRFLTFFTIVFLVVPLMIFAGLKDVEVKKIGGKMGTATYSHSKHANAGVKNCKSCHHKGSVKDSCSKCHKGENGKKAIHKNCIGCHKEMAKGPQKCNTCHKKK